MTDGSAIPQSGSLQERLQGLLYFVCVLEPNDFRPKNALTVVEHRGGQAFDAPKPLLHVLRPDHQRIANPDLARKLKRVLHVPHRVEFESDHYESARAIAV